MTKVNETFLADLIASDHIAVDLHPDIAAKPAPAAPPADSEIPDSVLAADSFNFG